MAIVLSTTFCNADTTDDTFQQPEKQDFFRHVLKSSVVYMKMQAHSSSEPPLKYSQDQTSLTNQASELQKSRLVITFSTNFGVTEILRSFKLDREGNADKEILESLRLAFLEKFLKNNFALSDAECNTSGWLNGGGIADLPLLRTLLAIRQTPKSQVSGK